MAIIGALPVTLTNGTIADATQVMADFNYILSQVNANAAPITGGTYLALTGGTLTGGLTVQPASGNASLTLNGAAATERVLIGQTAGVTRWSIDLGNTTGEGGSNVGSDFQVSRFTDGGVGIDTPITITRATGQVIIHQAGGGPEVSIPTIDGVVNTSRGWFIRTAGLDRWFMGAQSGGESGSNVGSDYAILRYNDAGTLIDAPLSITRASGTVTIGINVGTTVPGIKLGGQGIWYASYDASNVIAFNWTGSALTAFVNNVSKGTITPVVSDVRLKENVRPALGDALAELNALELISYDLPDRSTEGNPTKHFDCGFSAQQMEPIIPEAVLKSAASALEDTPKASEDLMRSLDYGPLLARCVGAIQQLTARVEALEAKLAIPT